MTFPPPISKPASTCSICSTPFVDIGTTGIRYCPICDTAKKRKPNR